VIEEVVLGNEEDVTKGERDEKSIVVVSGDSCCGSCCCSTA
jgi:hypothetical protein